MNNVSTPDQKQARKTQKCIFEVGKHTVKELIEKIFEEIDRLPRSKSTDLVELINLVNNLAAVSPICIEIIQVCNDILRLFFI